MRFPIPLLAFSFAAHTLALTFTSPLPGSTIDLTSPLKIIWIPSSSDPSTFTLSIINSLSGTSDQPQILATNLRTSSTSYTLPANTISSYGDGFELLAASSSGDSLAYSGAFSLADGVYTLQTASDGVLTIVTSSTQASAPSSTPVAVTSSSGSGSGNAVSSGAETSSMTAGTTASSPATATAGPTSSSARASSTQTQSSGATSSSASAAASSSSSDSNSNLGFDSAANVLKGNMAVSCAAFGGAVVFALLA